MAKKPTKKNTPAKPKQKAAVDKSAVLGTPQQAPGKAGKKRSAPPSPKTAAQYEAELDELAFPQFKGLGLTLKQQRFVLCYTRPDIAFNGTRAYIEAYDLDRVDDYMTAAASATNLLKNPKVQRAVSIELDRQLNDHDQLARRVMQEWQKLAFFDVTQFLNVSGPFVYLSSIDDLPAHFRPAIRSIENTQMGVKVTFHDKQKALESIAKGLGMFTENQRVVDEKYETLVQRLARQEAEGANATN